MPDNPTYPGVYVDETRGGVRTISGVPTGITAFVGRTRNGPVNEPVPIASFADFERIFGGLWLEGTVSFAIRDFFLNGGQQAIVVRLYRNAQTAPSSGQNTSDGAELQEEDFIPPDGEATRKGLYALEGADMFNILCLPPFSAASATTPPSLVAAAATYCEKRRAMYLVDPPHDWVDAGDARDHIGSVGTRSANAAIYFPRLLAPNPLRGGQPETFVPCGAVAGIYARTDTRHGVWKAPAGLDATLAGAPQLSVSVTDAEHGQLNPLGINCLRTLVPAGPVVWGARTLQGDDRLASEWKYVPVRRLALFIEESLYRGTQWVVFERNDEALWAQLRSSAGAFLHTLFRQGAFQGSRPQDAYLVKSGSETTTQDDIDRGIVNLIVGFAPLKPAEFVLLRIQQRTAGPA